ncbi:hypothetical protein KUTeg_024778 [Tegillarca granosa]|uniref:Transmembrane protein n=1 Tax=Tegillarca granosa TaxID=220873 RepID=A0ABQ9E2Z6_TEGGR|nr:hypothetical protein KUTeg_024778 [Tegillarca granosa]
MAEKSGPPPDYQPNYETPVNSGQPPPAYTDPSSVIRSDPPPSYESLFGRVKAAKQNSDSKVSCVKAVTGIILGTVGCTICLGVFLAIPISMIVIGAIYLHDCPAERYIPIYLIVAGCFGLVKNLSSLGNVWVYRTHGNWVADPVTSSIYCHPTCYYFAFWMITSTYILLGAMCCCICIGGIIAACCA